MSNDKIDNEYGWFVYNLEEMCKKDIEDGNGFIITEKKGLDKTKTERLEGGIFSPKYGTIWQDENAFVELYRCKCGNPKLQGKINVGMVCPECGEEVKFRDKNINIMGYFYLENYKLISPPMYRFIASLIGKKKLMKILSADWDCGTDGNVIVPTIDPDSKNIDKYDNIGIIEFRNHFDEIIEFFAKKKKEKRDVYEFILENRDKVFSSVFPVISLILRPIVLTDEDFNYAPINRLYQLISTKVYDLNNKYRDIDNTNMKIVNNNLFLVQKRIDEISTILFQSLKSKNGIIRNNIQGSRFNHTCRAVIVSKNYGKINEIDYPYLGFLTVFKAEILHYLCELNNSTINEAYILWQKALVKFNKKVYSVMEYIVNKFDVMVLLNRNPSLNYGSIARMKIAKVKKDYNDLTIAVPINVLGIFAGDYDGDALNSLALKDRDLINAYELYDPRTNMIISRNDGLFDNNFNLIKDQMICVHHICAISHKVKTLKIKKLKTNEKKIKNVKILTYAKEKRIQKENKKIKKM